MRPGIWEFIIIFAVILLFFGAKRLPEVGRSLGKAIREFGKAGKETEKDTDEVTKNEDASKEG